MKRREIDNRFNDENYLDPRPRYEMSYKSPNTLGGITAENRGRRNADEISSRWEKNLSPFENGKSFNWKHRAGWDDFYDQRYDKAFRKHGGSLKDHDLGNRGRGPKGYTRPDDAIYDNVCTTLELSPTVDARQIEVTVKDGVVYLDGVVKNRQMKKQAELEIEHISGVYDVQNLLEFGV